MSILLHMLTVNNSLDGLFIKICRKSFVLGFKCPNLMVQNSIDVSTTRRKGLCFSFFSKTIFQKVRAIILWYSISNENPGDDVSG